jgi:hypothetical protein
MDLTPHQQQRIGQARKLAGISGPGAIREYAGTDDLAMGYATAYGAAREIIAELVSFIEQLTAVNA